MLDDFTPIIHELPGRTAKLYAIADVHLGSPECELDEFIQFLAKIKREPDSYICIVGDLLNNATRSSVSNVYAETMPPSAQVDKAVELLAPVADRILGCVGGNHERRSRKEVDLDPLYEVMCLLRKPELYRPNMAFVRVRLTNGKSKDSYAIMMTHGKSLAKRNKFVSIVEGIDAAIVAHTHTPDVLMPGRIRFTQKNKVVVHEVVSLTACSWLRPGGYSLSGMYPVQATSRPQCLELEYTGSNNTSGRIRVIW
jgi:predicted MPP superfamily phosphohydrolase